MTAFHLAAADAAAKPAKLWIITERERSVTTLLLPSDYCHSSLSSVHTGPVASLALLPTQPDDCIDYEAADPLLLGQLAGNAETVMHTINLGLAAIGTVPAQASSEVGSKMSSSTVEALGCYIAEVSA